jgi:hypothetical protein
MTGAGLQQDGQRRHPRLQPIVVGLLERRLLEWRLRRDHGTVCPSSAVRRVVQDEHLAVRQAPQKAIEIQFDHRHPVACGRHRSIVHVFDHIARTVI